MAKEVFIPKLGQTMEEVTLLAWHVKDGEKIEKGQTIAEVETDKAVFPIESNAKGIVHLGSYQPNQVIPVLTVIAIVGTENDVFKTAEKTQAQPEEPIVSQKGQEPPVSGETVVPQQTHDKTGTTFISPRAKKLAVENQVNWNKIQPTGNEGQRVVERDIINFLAERPKATPIAGRIAADSGIDLSDIHGSGPGGRIMKQDVLQAAGKDTAQGPLTEVIKTIPLSGIRGVIFSRMAESTQSTSRVTLFMEADATRLVELRETIRQKYSGQWGYTAGYNDLLAVICGRALKEFPYMNARINGNQIEWLGRVHMGMAVDTDRGLVVPVIKDSDRKPLRQFGEEFRMLVEKARLGTLLPDDYSDGTFTITNLGNFDVMAFTPVINLPQAAILGVGKISPALMMKNGVVTEYQKMVLSLVFDHRIVDGAPAARFLQWIKDRIEFPELLGFD